MYVNKILNHIENDNNSVLQFTRTLSGTNSIPYKTYEKTGDKLYMHAAILCTNMRIIFMYTTLKFHL